MGLPNKNNENTQRLIDRELSSIIVADFFLGIITAVCIMLPAWCYFNQPTWTVASWVVAFCTWFGLVGIYLKLSELF